MISSALYYSPEHGVRGDLTLDEVAELARRKEGLLWIDMQGTSPEDVPLLSEVFHFHHLAIDDCLSTALHPPKVDEFPDHIFIIVHGVSYDGGAPVV
ncbi:MAG: hypothetical protein EXR60_03130, partial [Dehalococcoidia bacterium]|nr:hypothetical protein [Dehalococcoidia bacterium]